MPDDNKIYVGPGKISQKSCDGGCLSIAGDSYDLIYEVAEDRFYIEYKATVAQIGSWGDRWALDEAKEYVPEAIWEEAQKQVNSFQKEASSRSNDVA